MFIVFERLRGIVNEIYKGTERKLLSFVYAYFKNGVLIKIFNQSDCPRQNKNVNVGQVLLGHSQFKLGLKSNYYHE